VRALSANRAATPTRPERRVTVRDLRQMKERGQPIPMLTAYDYPTARLLDEAGVPVLLVGDSLGMTVLGYETTCSVTVAEMVHHTRAVARGARRALVVADLPFLSYHESEAQALRNAGRLVRDGGAQAVKLEGGAQVAATVARLVGAGIPVMGHIGLTPQSVHQLGGYRIQGRSRADAERLLADAIALEEAGAFAVVLELVPAELASAITRRLAIPTIGIGAGPDCDGQVQVLADILGLTFGHVPRHARLYGDVGGAIRQAVAAYLRDVSARTFPGEENTFRGGETPSAPAGDAAADTAGSGDRSG
jgi:3-methyl-2-oxobutanoate hydroxymethyltransferase